MKKVLFFIDTLYQGGAETLVKDYALLLDKTKFDVTILCLRRTNSEYEKILFKHGIKVIYLYEYIPFKETNFIHRIIFKILRILYLDHLLARIVVKKINPDVIHAHLYIIHYIRWLNFSNVKRILYTCHSLPQMYWHCKTKFSKREFFCAQWLVRNKAMQFIALHESMRQELNNLFGVQNTVVVNNGIDMSRFSNFVPKNEMREKLHIPQEAFVVGHVGRFAAVKNHEFILNLFKEFLKVQKNAILLLVGNGPLLGEIKNKVAELNLTGKVYFLDNRLDIPDIMNAMDVFLFPSIYEGLGIVLIEAQKTGLPCVVSDCVPIAATISNLVTSLSLNQPMFLWVEALRKVAPSKIVYKDFEKWDMNNIIKKIEQLYS